MNDLQNLNSNNSVAIWDNPDFVSEVKKIYGKNLTDIEFKIFLELGYSTGLNPFKGELWAIKYGNAAAQMFIGRDGYRTSIGRNPAYISHIVDAVYENDDFEVDAMNNIFRHRHGSVNRGKLVAAYCLVYMRGSDRPVYSYCLANEFDKNMSVWKTMPSLMLKKCAEAAAIRQALPAIYNGTILPEEERPELINPTSRNNENLGVEAVSKIIDHNEEILVENDSVEDMEAVLFCIIDSDTFEELQKVAETIKTYNFKKELRDKLLEAFKRKKIELKEQGELV